MRDLENISFLVLGQRQGLTGSGKNQSDTGESHERRASLGSSGLESLFRKVETASAEHEQMCWQGDIRR